MRFNLFWIIFYLVSVSASASISLSCPVLTKYKVTPDYTTLSGPLEVYNNKLTTPIAHIQFFERGELLVNDSSLVASGVKAIYLQSDTNVLTGFGYTALRGSENIYSTITYFDYKYNSGDVTLKLFPKLYIDSFSLSWDVNASMFTGGKTPTYEVNVAPYASAGSGVGSTGYKSVPYTKTPIYGTSHYVSFPDSVKLDLESGGDIKQFKIDLTYTDGASGTAFAGGEINFKIQNPDSDGVHLRFGSGDGSTELSHKYGSNNDLVSIDLSAYADKKTAGGLYSKIIDATITCP